MEGELGGGWVERRRDAAPLAHDHGNHVTAVLRKNDMHYGRKGRKSPPPLIVNNMIRVIFNLLQT